MESQEYYLNVSPLESGRADAFAFTYSFNEELSAGTFVSVPFGRKTLTGIVAGSSSKPNFAVKPIQETLDFIPLPQHLVNLAEWLASYYAASPKAVWQTILPRGLAKKRRVSKNEVGAFKLPKTDFTLTAEQQAALKTIRNGAHNAYLLQGVTSSGKTQVYIELTKEALAAGKSAIVLVPEIALTPQLVANFEAAFGDVVLSTHSRMTEAQRHKVWTAALTSESPRIVIGPRSSLFAPVASLGLIIIDEAHETSYKQGQAPRYNALHAAGKLAKLTNSKLVMGSATPGLTELHLALAGKIGHTKLTTRANKQAAPNITVVDLKDRALFTPRSRFLTKPLLAKLEATLTEGRQSLLFINRRGSASSQICGDCGTVSLCPHCELPLTFHADHMMLMCHYCNFSQQPAAVCTQCQSMNVRYLGGGTKRIEAEIAKLLPTARLARLDKDSATPKHLHEVFTGLHKGTIDILIGTQMIAKGLDLPSLDFVGVVSADTSLYLPDFTASERTFQLMSQVSGRSGRGERRGEVIIQTYTPNHPAIRAASSHDFDGFAATELEQRRLLNYPPYANLLKLTCALSSQAKAETKAEELIKHLSQNPKLQLLGPAPAYVEKNAGRYHWQVIAKARSRLALVEAVKNLPAGWTADLDPANLL